MSGIKIEFGEATDPFYLAIDADSAALIVGLSDDNLEKINRKKAELQQELRADITAGDVENLDDDKKKKLLLLQQIELALAKNSLVGMTDANELASGKAVAQSLLQDTKLLKHYIFGIPYTDDKNQHIDLNDAGTKQSANAKLFANLQQSLPAADDVVLTPDPAPAPDLAATPKTPESADKTKTPPDTDKSDTGKSDTDKKALPGAEVANKKEEKLDLYSNNPFELKNHSVVGQMLEVLGHLFALWPFQIVAHYALRFGTTASSLAQGVSLTVSGGVIKFFAYGINLVTLGRYGATLHGMADKYLAEGEALDGTLPMLYKPVIGSIRYVVGSGLTRMGFTESGKAVLLRAQENLDSDGLMKNLRNSGYAKVARLAPNIIYEPINIMVEKVAVGVGHIGASFGNLVTGNFKGFKDHASAVPILGSGPVFVWHAGAWAVTKLFWGREYSAAHWDAAGKNFRRTGGVFYDVAASVLTNAVDLPRAVAPPVATGGALKHLRSAYDVAEEIAPSWFSKTKNIARWNMEVDVLNSGPQNSPDSPAFSASKTFFKNTLGGENNVWRNRALMGAGMVLGGIVLPALGMAAWNKYKYGSVFGASIEGYKPKVALIGVNGQENYRLEHMAQFGRVAMGAAAAAVAKGSAATMAAAAKTIGPAMGAAADAMGVAKNAIKDAAASGATKAYNRAFPSEKSTVGFAESANSSGAGNRLEVSKSSSLLVDFDDDDHNSDNNSSNGSFSNRGISFMPGGRNSLASSRSILGSDPLTDMQPRSSSLSAFSRHLSSRSTLPSYNRSMNNNNSVSFEQIRGPSESSTGRLNSRLSV